MARLGLEGTVSPAGEATLKPRWPARRFTAASARWRMVSVMTESEQAVLRVLAAARGATRRERQHVEIVALAFVGELIRARALRAAHLAEFPDDVLIVHLFDLLESRPRTP
jgi:hypothetical protein